MSSFAGVVVNAMQVNSLEVFVDNMLVEPKLSLGYIKSILAMQDELLTLAKDEDLTIETQLQSTMHARLLGKGVKLLNGLLSILDAPYIKGTLEEQSDGTEPITLAKDVLVAILQKVPGFLDLAVEQGVIPQLLQIMHKPRPTRANRDNAFEVVRDALGDQPTLEDAYRTYLKNEDPEKSAIVSLTLWSLSGKERMLLRSGMVHALMAAIKQWSEGNYGGDETAGDLLESLSYYVDPNTVVDPDAVEDEEEDEETKNKRGLDSVMNQQVYSTDGKATILRAWLEISEIKASRQLGVLINKIIELYEGVNLVATSVHETFNTIRVRNPISDPSVTKFINILKLFFRMRGTEDEIKQVIVKMEGFLPFLVDIVSGYANGSSTEIPSPIYYGACELLGSIKSVDGGYELLCSLLDDTLKYEALLSSITRLSEFEEQRPSPEDSRGAGAGTLVVALLDDPAIQETVIQNFYENLFNPQTSPNPTYGGRLFQNHLQTQASQWLDSGILAYMCRVMANTEVGSYSWSYALYTIKALHELHQAVDLFANAELLRILKVVLAAPVEGDYEKSSRAVCGAAELIYAFISDLDGEELQPFTETGFASYFVKIVADANIRIDVRIAARLALEKLMSVETVLDEVRAQEEVIDGLVRMMLKLNKNEQERLNKDFQGVKYKPEPTNGGADILIAICGSNETPPPMVVSSIKRVFDSCQTLDDRKPLLQQFPYLVQDGGWEAGPTLSPAVFQAGLVPFIFSVVNDPALEVEERYNATGCIHQYIGWKDRHVYIARALFDHPEPGFMAMCAQGIRSDYLQEKWSSFQTLSNASQYDAHDRKKIFEYQDHAFVELAVEEFGRAAGTGIDGKKEEDLDKESRDYREGHAKLHACQLLLDLITADYGDDGKTVEEMKKVYREFGVPNGLKFVKRNSFSRDAAKELFSILKEEREGSRPIGYDATEFESWCTLVADQKADPEDRAMAMRDLEAILDDPECQHALAERPDVIKSLVGLILVRPKNISPAEEVDALEDDDVRKRASCLLNAFPESTDDTPSPLFDLLVETIEEKFESLKNGAHKIHVATLEPVRRAFESSVGGPSCLPYALIKAGLPSFLNSICLNLKTSNITLMQAMKVITTNILNEEASQTIIDGFMEAGSVDAYLTLVQNALKKRPKKGKARDQTPQRAPGFLGLLALAGDSSERLIKIYNGSPTIIKDLITEISWASGPMSTEKAFSMAIEIDWEAEEPARWAPLKLLDKLSAEPSLFKEVKEKAMAAGVIAVFDAIRDENGDFFGSEGYIQSVSEEMVVVMRERFELDELPKTDPTNQEDE